MPPKSSCVQSAAASKSTTDAELGTTVASVSRPATAAHCPLKPSIMMHLQDQQASSVIRWIGGFNVVPVRMVMSKHSRPTVMHGAPRYCRCKSSLERCSTSTASHARMHAIAGTQTAALQLHRLTTCDVGGFCQLIGTSARADDGGGTLAAEDVVDALRRWSHVRLTPCCQTARVVTVVIVGR